MAAFAGPRDGPNIVPFACKPLLRDVHVDLRVRTAIHAFVLHDKKKSVLL